MKDQLTAVFLKFGINLVEAINHRGDIRMELPRRTMEALDAELQGLSLFAPLRWGPADPTAPNPKIPKPYNGEPITISTSAGMIRCEVAPFGPRAVVQAEAISGTSPTVRIGQTVEERIEQARREERKRCEDAALKALMGAGGVRDWQEAAKIAVRAIQALND